MSNVLDFLTVKPELITQQTKANEKRERIEFFDRSVLQRDFAPPRRDIKMKALAMLFAAFVIGAVFYLATI